MSCVDRSYFGAICGVPEDDGFVATGSCDEFAIKAPVIGPYHVGVSRECADEGMGVHVPDRGCCASAVDDGLVGPWVE